MRMRAWESTGQPSRRTESTGPRVVIGIGLVAAAAVVAFATHGGGAGVPALVAARPVAEGTALDAGALQQATVEVPDPTVLYQPPLAADVISARSLAPGEPLLARDVTTRRPDDRRITLPIAAQAMPADLVAGERVDVWRPGQAATPLIADAVVAGVSPPDLGDARVEIVVGPADIERAVAATTTPDIVLARLP